MLLLFLLVNFLNSIHLSLGIRVAQWVRSLDLTTHTSLSPIRRGFAPSFVNYKKGCTRLAAASDTVYQLLAQGRWFSPASSTTKTDRHDIAEILLKVALNSKIQKFHLSFIFLALLIFAQIFSDHFSSAASFASIYSSLALNFTTMSTNVTWFHIS